MLLTELNCYNRVSKKDKKTGEIKHYNVNACLMPVLAADGCHVTTVEGIGTVKGDNMHPVQKAMTDLHGSQCGTSTRKHSEKNNDELYDCPD
jgi:xanthine dehydrogenase/oxidase